MTDLAQLERRYRRLLACYPRAFRAEHEEEMLVVLLACVRDGRRDPGLADSANLIVNALRVRLRPRAPRSVPAAYWGVRIMLLVAVLELAAGATVVTSRGAVAHAVARHLPQFSSAHVTALVGAHSILVLIGAPIAAMAWLAVARANDCGRRWGRAGAVALLILTSVSLLSGIGDGAARFAVADLVAGVVLWTVSLLATGLILSADANRHYCGTGAGRGGSRRVLPPWAARYDRAALN